jgi:putative membrane protein
VFVGFGRAILAAQGWSYYSHNLFFWAKIGTFVAIGLLSIPPTLSYLKWRKGGAAPTDEAVANVRRYFWVEVVLSASLFAPATARGCGQFWSNISGYCGHTAEGMPPFKLRRHAMAGVPGLPAHRGR